MPVHFLIKPVCLALFMALGLVSGASAQTAAASDLQRQVDDAFKEVIGKVSSNEARARYASLLVKAGNFEGGIAALEGLLLAPDAPASIRVELAVLYYRLGSYAMAENYLREALADARLDAALKRQAEDLLVDAVKRNQPSRLSGSLMVGLRSQSNPTAAPGHSQILAYGLRVPRDAGVKPRSDIDTQVWGQLEHTYDLRNQNETSIVTSLVGFGNHYALNNNPPSYAKPSDIFVVAGTTGIRFKPAPSEHKNFTLMPYAIYGDTLVKGRQLFSVGGVGLEGANQYSDRFSLSGAIELRDFSFSSRSDMADSSQQSGLEQAYRLRGMFDVGLNRFVVAELGYVDHDAKRGYFEYRGPDLRVSYFVSYASPFSGGANWTTTLTGEALQRYYRAADPVILAGTKRRDTEYRLSLVNSVPLARDTALQVQLDYTKNTSNIVNYEYSNFAGTVGVIWKF